MHDDDYDRGGNNADRKDADRQLFFRMMKKVTDERNKHPSAFVWMTIIAYIYYMAVRVFGRFYFNYQKE